VVAGGSGGRWAGAARLGWRANAQVAARVDRLAHRHTNAASEGATGSDGGKCSGWGPRPWAGTGTGTGTGTGNGLVGGSAWGCRWLGGCRGLSTPAV